MEFVENETRDRRLAALVRSGDVTGTPEKKTLRVQEEIDIEATAKNHPRLGAMFSEETFERLVHDVLPSIERCVFEPSTKPAPAGERPPFVGVDGITRWLVTVYARVPVLPVYVINLRDADARDLAQNRLNLHGTTPIGHQRAVKAMQVCLRSPRKYRKQEDVEELARQHCCVNPGPRTVWEWVKARTVAVHMSSVCPTPVRFNPEPVDSEKKERAQLPFTQQVLEALWLVPREAAWEPFWVELHRVGKTGRLSPDDLVTLGKWAAPAK